MAFIRPYKFADWNDTAFICRATLPPSIINEKTAIRLAPYLWTHQFTLLNPQNCFVLDDGTGHVVGYVVGSTDVHDMAARYGRFTDLIGGTGPVEGVPAEVVELARREVGPAPADLDNLQPFLVPDPSDPSGQKSAVNETHMLQQAYNPRWLLLESNQTPLRKELISGTKYRAVMHIDMLESHQGQGWGREMIKTFLASIAKEGARGLQIGVSGENTKVVPFYEKCGFRVQPGGEADGCVWMVRDVSETGW
ncbi:acetyltransferase [Sporothrix brasiliensis 5110]|uniref:Acetyltransferase n=1 Tax=Sporothrix brasiliensis 5110 TaxID=1398154 RepID=A0A0C2ISM0_9PEZI|nr:acetyltransferase [Sporothrix brasiliensis 5110]KIH92056.1 acetyltransferase [Sporothrix brasiliensis 5110]